MQDILYSQVMTPDEIDGFNEHLANIPEDEFDLKNNEQLEKDQREFQEFSEAIKISKCSFCSKELDYFSKHKPCFHWLLYPKGFKQKKHFPLLYKKYSFHEIESYLRWLANTEKRFVNINDLVEEKSSSKKIEETIKYKNFEWSFSCSQNCFQGLEKRHNNQPHYHFQMRKDDNVVIKYAAHHIPFHEYDFFSFAVKDGKFPKIKPMHIQGAGMQTFFDSFDDEELIDMVRSTDDEENAQVHMQTLLVADEGTTISGDDIADLLKERDRTGESMAKLVKKLKNVRATTFVQPGPGVPEIAKRTPRKGR